MFEGESSIEIIIYSVIGIAVGITLFIKGFGNLKLKRLIENLPTSKIRSVPMGLVEICGKALKTFEMSTPFSDIPCVFFRYLVEKYKKSGKSGSWVTVKSYSSPLHFQIDDGTGTVSVNPCGAEIDLKNMNRYSNTMFQSIPARALKFMDMNGINYKSFLGTKQQMRLTEHYITPGSLVYVLGDVRHAGKSLLDEPDYIKKIDGKKAAIEDTLKKLKKSPLLMEKYDSNKDGRIDSIEWEKAREDVARWVDYNMSKEDRAKVEDIKLEIGKSMEKHPFFISDYSEKEICSKMFWKISPLILGGSVLTIISSVVLVFLLSRL